MRELPQPLRKRLRPNFHWDSPFSSASTFSRPAHGPAYQRSALRSEQRETASKFTLSCRYLRTWMEYCALWLTRRRPTPSFLPLLRAEPPLSLPHGANSSVFTQSASFSWSLFPQPTRLCVHQNHLALLCKNWVRASQWTLPETSACLNEPR